MNKWIINIYNNIHISNVYLLILKNIKKLFIHTFIKKIKIKVIINYHIYMIFQNILTFTETYDVYVSYLRKCKIFM